MDILLLVGAIMANNPNIGSRSVPDNQMDALLESINQIDQAEMSFSASDQRPERLPAEGDIGGSFEWDLNDACITEPRAR